MQATRYCSKKNQSPEYLPKKRGSVRHQCVLFFSGTLFEQVDFSAKVAVWWICVSEEDLERVNGVGKNGVGAIAITCFKNFNLEILSNVWKPASMAVGMAKRSRSTAVQGGCSVRATQACVPRRNKKTLCAPALRKTLREWSARTTSIHTWRSAPQAASCWEK